ncbi:MAG: hypothetical protein E7321_10765 [Clostridiales bacterium]|nr:hypothetical protein [Clostridiales bacterium]
MKRGFALILALLLLAFGSAALAEEVPPLCGVVLVSDSMGGDWSILAERRHLDAVLYPLDDEWHDIAMDVPDERVVEIIGGQELYLILPMDADATVSVVHLSDDEENLIYHSETGEPFLLRCNAAPSPWEEDPYLSDFEEVTEPFDCRILIVDSMDHVLIWNPYVHFNRGEVNTDALGGCVIDFTNY